MAEFKKLSEVEQIESVSDNATVLVEDGGEIKRVSKSEVGGAGGIKTAIIKDSNYDNAIAGISTMIGAPSVAYECINMTFEEAYQTITSGEPLLACGMFSGEGIGIMPGKVVQLLNYEGTLIITLDFNGIYLVWNSEGLFMD